MSKPDHAAHTETQSKGKRPRRKRRLVRWLGIGTVLLVVLIALAPTIAGPVLRPIVEARANEQLAGSVSLSKLKVGWFGPQTVTGATLRDPTGTEVAAVSVRADTSLLRLATGGLDLGKIAIAGRATIIRDAEGRTNLERALEARAPAAPTPPAPPSGGGGATLPRGLRARVVLDALDVVYQDAAIASATEGKLGAIGIKGLKGSATIEPGKPALLTLRGTTVSGVDASGVAPSGEVVIDASVEDYTDASGTFTLDAMHADVSVALSGPGARAALQASLQNGVLTGAGPIEASIDLAKLGELVPALARAASTETLSVAALPTVTLRVSELRMPAPIGGAPPDLRGAGLVAGLEMASVAGTVVIPGGSDGAQTFEIDPLALTLDARELARGLTLTGGTQARIAGQSAGSLGVNISASGLLESDGSPRAGVPGSIDGGVEIVGFSTPILQPFVEAINASLPGGGRIDLVTDLGPTLDLRAGARTRPGEASGAGTPAPAFDTDLTLVSANANIEAALSMDGTRITTRDRGVRASFISLAPVLDRFLSASGVRVDSGASLTIEASDVAIDTAALTGPSGPDLRGTSATLRVSTDGLKGRAPLDHGKGTTPFSLAKSTVDLATTDVNGRVELRVKSGAGMDGKPLASVDVDLAAAGLLDEAGAPATSTIPKVGGAVRVQGVNAVTLDKLLGPMLEPLGLRLAQDLGERIDLAALTAPDPTNPDATTLDVTLTSAQASVTAPLTLEFTGGASPTLARVRSREPVNIVHRAAGDTLGRLAARAQNVSFRPGGTVRVTLTDIDLPLQGGVRPDKIRAAASFAAEGLSLALAPDGAVEGSPARMVPLGVKSLSVRAALTPGQAPSAGVGGVLSHEDREFSLTGDATLEELFFNEPRDAKDPMSVLNTGGARPRATVTLSKVPSSLVHLTPMSARTVNGRALDVVAIARETLGQTFDVTLGLTPAKNNPRMRNFDASLRGANVSVRAQGGHAADLLRVFKLEADLGVTPRTAQLALAALAPELPVAPRLTGPARFVLSAQPVSIPLGAGGAPDFARATESLAARLVANVPLDALTLPGGEDTEPMVIPATTLTDFTVDAGLPLAALAPEGTGSATLTLTGGLDSPGTGRVATLTGKAQAALRAGAPAGAMPLELTLSGVRSAWVDGVLAQPELLVGALGPDFTLDVTGDLDRLAKRATGKPGPLAAKVTSSRVSMSTPLALAFSKDALYLQDALTIDWTMPAAWGNRYALGAKAGKEQSLRFTGDVPAKVSLTRLALAQGEGVGPLKAGVFVADATVTIPAASMMMGDGRTLGVGDVTLRVGRGPTPDQMGFALEVPRMKIGAEPEFRPRKSLINGRLAGFADEAGNPSFASARLNVEGGLEPIPTDLIDGLARQGGLLTAALGPQVNFSISARDLSMQGGGLTATALAPLARASIIGVVKDGLFIIDPKSVVEVSRVTPELTRRLQKALPVVATLEKTTSDEPARVVFETPIAVPLDGTFDRLNGKLTLDIGTARFTTGDLFQKVLQVVQQRDSGTIGRRLPPLKLMMKDGLVSYEPFALPFGEFKIETQGFINLSTKARQIREGGANDPKNLLQPRQLEVLTFIPSGAFAAEAIPGLANIPLPVLGELARLPIRTMGPIASPKNDVAVDLVGQEAVNTLLQPGKLLEDAGKGLFEDLLGGGKKQD